jgi:site-specific recombinase XerD
MHALSPNLQLNFPVPTRPTPLEGLLLPPDLSGAAGNNRAPNAPTLISATHDLAALVAWLARYADTPATLQAYRREVERAVNWTVIERGKPFSSLTHEDLLVYERFLANPQPAERWVLAGKKKLARNHPDWRPFAGPLSPSAVRHALVILNACFAWLTESGYLAGNPLSLARRRRVSSKPRITRYLSHDMWDLVKETIELLPVDTDRARQHAVRCRWLFTVFYLGGLRASEVTGTTMGAFFCRRDSKGIERWWLEVTGKGVKTRLVPATDEVMAELTSYRLAHRLSALPQAGETTPVVLPVIGREKPLTRGALHLIVKEVFKRTADRLREKGPDGSALAVVVEQASAHWMRHTAGSHMADENVDLRHVRDTFGHASIATSNAYLHSEDDARHEAIQERHRIDWRKDRA